MKDETDRIQSDGARLKPYYREEEVRCVPSCSI